MHKAAIAEVSWGQETDSAVEAPVVEGVSELRIVAAGSQWETGAEESLYQMHVLGDRGDKAAGDSAATNETLCANRKRFCLL